MEIPQFLVRNLNHHPGSELGELEGTVDHKERNSKTRSARKLNGAHHGVRALVEIQILHFLLVFF